MGIKNKRFLIIGGLGFIGKNLYLKLKKNNYKAQIISNMPPKENDPFNRYLDKNDLIFGDIQNRNFLEKIIINYDVIFSLAGISGAKASNANPYKNIDINLIGHLNILEVCRLKNPNALLLFPSSRLVYGKPEYTPVDERHILNPESFYATHKITAENYYLLYNNLHGVNSIIFRISNPYGPFQDYNTTNYGILNHFIQSALNNEIIEIFGDGLQKRDYLYIDDLSDLLIKSINIRDLSGKVFNVGYGRGISLIEMIELIKKYLPNLSYRHIPWPDEFKKIETGDYITDTKKINQITGWKPKISFEKGVLKTIKFYKNIYGV